MKKTRFAFFKCWILTGILSAWSILVISCVSTNTTRQVTAPLSVPGANYVGSAECATCHDSITKHFADAAHSRLIASTDNSKNTGCESCHGAGSVHVDAGGGAGTIINPQKSPETCFQCHLDKRAEFRLAHSHPVLSGKMSCTDCHDPHKRDTIKGGGTQLASANATCAKCHAAQSKPHAFEHQAMREGCTFCHNPHGTVNAKMLKIRNQVLCLQCHAQRRDTAGNLFIGRFNHTSSVQRGACWTSGCHEAPHGSNVSPSLRY